VGWELEFKVWSVLVFVVVSVLVLVGVLDPCRSCADFAKGKGELLRVKALFTYFIDCIWREKIFRNSILGRKLGRKIISNSNKA
jgi:hypothetical protein